METPGCGTNRPQGPSNDIWYWAGHPHYIACPGYKMSDAESDISVSTLLGFETFAIFLWVPVSVLENLVSEKRFGIGFLKFGLRKTVQYRFPIIWSQKKTFSIGFPKFGLSKTVRYRFPKIWASELLSKMLDGVDG